MKDLRALYGHNPTELELTLKSPIELNNTDLSITAKFETFTDYGMTLGVFVKTVSPDGKAAALGILENDEIVKVCDFDAISIERKGQASHGARIII